jgi:hypothetical protein
MTEKVMERATTKATVKAKPNPLARRREPWQVQSLS